MGVVHTLIWTDERPHSDAVLRAELTESLAAVLLRTRP
jgi:hypothetical protein